MGSEVAKKLKITLKRSAIAAPRDQKATLKALGLTKLNRTRVLSDTPQVRGMVTKVRHLVTVGEVEE